MTVYSFSQMQYDIPDFLMKPEIYLDPYHLFFLNQYNFGLRFNEVTNAKNWIRLTDSTVQVPLSKGQSTRILTYDPYYWDVLFYHIETLGYFNFANQTTASQLFLRHFPRRLFLNSGKALTTHFFRHYYVKNKSNMGWTPTQIASDIGEVNVNNINGYINSIIMYP